MPLSTITSNGLTSEPITAGTYGGANNVPVFTVGTDGRISGISTSNLYADSNSVILKTNTATYTKKSLDAVKLYAMR